MPLEPTDWDLVHRVVVEDLVGTDNPYQILRTYFPREVETWSITNVADQNARMLIEQARTASMRDDEPFAIRLLDALTRLPAVRTARPAEHAKLEEYLRRLRDVKAGLDTGAPYQVNVIPWSGQVFLDRKAVRQSLQQMISPPPGKPELLALCVSGGADVGKSYTYELIRHLSTAYDFALARVILQPSYGAEDVLRDLQVQVTQREIDVDRDGDLHKQLRYWALRLAGQLGSGADGPWWWVVFDDCERLDPGSDAVGLIAQLARAMADMTMEKGARHHRLVLLGQADEMDLPMAPMQVARDFVEPLGESDLRDFFTAYIREVDGDDVDMSAVSELVDVAVKQVLAVAAGAEQQGERYMAALHRATREVLNVYAG